MFRLNGSSLGSEGQSEKKELANEDCVVTCAYLKRVLGRLRPLSAFPYPPR